MGRHNEKTPTIFTKLAYGLLRKQPPAIVPLSKSLGPPAPQTSLVFELPDELILSILSYISPGPQFISYHARFRVLYCMGTDEYHQKRVRCLRRLSMTCRAMWLRLLPWLWERLECLQVAPSWSPEGRAPRKLNAILKTLSTDQSLTLGVKFMAVRLMWSNSTLPKFIKCLESLPNLHTLEIGQTHIDITTPLGKALKGVELPQIKALVLSPTAHPLLRHCRNVEDVVCVVAINTTTSDEFLTSLASNRNSKFKQLAIPLVSLGSLPRDLTAFTRLTELTVIYPHPFDRLVTETGVPLDVVETARSAILELVNACKTLPDFNTFQIVYVHFLVKHPYPPIRGYERTRDGVPPTMEQRRQALRDLMKGVKNVAIDCLKKPEIGCQQGEGRKRTTLRVIELGAYRPPGGPDLDCITVEKVEECEV